MQRRCSVCKYVKDIGEFTKDRHQSGGHKYYCRECAWSVLRPMAFRRNYGITEEEYSRLAEKQKNLCAICEKKESQVRHGRVIKLAVDHCHRTGKIRGLLCAACNKGVGIFADNPALVDKVRHYLVEK